MNRFLIIEDNKVMACVLAELLKKCLEPVEIQVATQPAKAYTLLNRQEFDGVFLDLNLLTPLDGLDILCHLKETYSSLPVVIVTGDSDMDTVKKAINYKPTDYLIKPLSIYKIERCIERIKHSKRHIQLSIDP